MVEDRRTFEPTESMEDAERLFMEGFDTWDMTGYYLYSKLLRSGVSRHIGTWGFECRIIWQLSQVLSLRISSKVECKLVQLPYHGRDSLGDGSDIGARA